MVHFDIKDVNWSYKLLKCKKRNIFNNSFAYYRPKNSLRTKSFVVYINCNSLTSGKIFRMTRLAGCYRNEPELIRYCGKPYPQRGLTDLGLDQSGLWKPPHFQRKLKPAATAIVLMAIYWIDHLATRRSRLFWVKKGLLVLACWGFVDWKWPPKWGSDDFTIRRLYDCSKFGAVQ